MLRGVSRAAAALAVLGAAAAARADAEIVELHYDAPAGCPARSAFESAILARTPSVRLGAPARRVFEVTIEATSDGFAGALVVDRVADKELAAPRCEDLATALALVTALAIDPAAGAAPRSESREPVWSLETEAGAMLAGGVGPEPLLAVAIEGRAIRRRAYALELTALAGRDTAARDGARARFTWLAARAGGCRRWRLREVGVDACGHLEAGAVRAAGQEIINQRALTRPWLAGGVHAGARYPIGTRGFGVLQLGASVPLLRDRYLFAPNVTIHETPAVTAWLIAGIGMRFR